MTFAALAAKLCRAAGGELEPIQLLLGHASVSTTQKLIQAASMNIGVRLGCFTVLSLAK